ncbi:MAG: SDR family oxidoreductase [Cytophagales bacterium]|nr:MAG: SDR family oxidoreductase [Cytophagales bacterium]
MKNILIVGGNSGIGLSLAHTLSNVGGYTLYSISRRRSDELAQLNIHQQSVDISKPLGSALQFLPETLHGLVYCPGTINLKPFNRLTENDFLEDFQVNVLGAIRILQETHNRLKKANGASVVLFSTVAVQVGMAFHASVSVAKAGVEGLTKSLAAEWATLQIRVNAIAPSLTDTPLATKILSTQERREASNKRHPMGRIGNAQDIANAAEFLLSEKASWITGQIIGIDGGMSTLKP